MLPRGEILSPAHGRGVRDNRFILYYIPDRTYHNLKTSPLTNDVSEQHKVRPSLNFEAFKLLNVRSGIAWYWADLPIVWPHLRF